MSFPKQMPSSRCESRSILDEESQYLLDPTKHENGTTSGGKKSKGSSVSEGVNKGYNIRATSSVSGLGSTIHSNMPHTTSGKIDWSDICGWLWVAFLISTMAHMVYWLYFYFRYTIPAENAAGEAEKNGKAAAVAAEAVLRLAAFKAQIKGVETLSDLLVELKGLRAAAEIIAGSME